MGLYTKLQMLEQFSSYAASAILFDFEYQVAACHLPYSFLTAGGCVGHLLCDIPGSRSKKGGKIQERNPESGSAVPLFQAGA